MLAGGRPRGTLYAVYEFLERPIGCHWLDRETEIVPSRPTLAVDALDVRAKPWFWIRHVSSPTGSPKDHWLFLVRNRNYRYRLAVEASGRRIERDFDLTKAGTSELTIVLSTET